MVSPWRQHGCQRTAARSPPPSPHPGRGNSVLRSLLTRALARHGQGSPSSPQLTILAPKARLLEGRASVGAEGTQPSPQQIPELLPLEKLCPTPDLEIAQASCAAALTTDDFNKGWTPGFASPHLT